MFLLMHYIAFQALFFVQLGRPHWFCVVLKKIARLFSPEAQLQNAQAIDMPPFLCIATHAQFEFQGALATLVPT